MNKRKDAVTFEDLRKSLKALDTKILQVTVEDYAKENGITFNQAIGQLAREKPEIFNNWLQGK
jgi:hypothetical protein